MRFWGKVDKDSRTVWALGAGIRKEGDKELEIRERKRLMAQKARDLVFDYTEDEELPAFTDLDGEDFYETEKKWDINHSPTVGAKIKKKRLLLLLMRTDPIS